MNIGKALIVLLIGGVVTYLLLKAREAKAAEKKPKEELPLSFTIPEVKQRILPEGWAIDMEKGIVTYRKNGEITVDINWLIQKMPFLKHLKISAIPYYTKSVYE